MRIDKPQALHEMGSRKNNEDCIYPPKGEAGVESRFFLVCDGVGGNNLGEVASETVCKAFATFLESTDPDDFDASLFNRALAFACQELDGQAGTTDPDSPSRMATTLTFLHLYKDGVFMAHIGDSRIYHFRQEANGEVVIRYKSEDHSLVNELVKGGIITAEEALTHTQRNIITRVIQAHPNKPIEAEIYETRHVLPGDYFLLCTDGLLEQLTDQDLCTLMAEAANAQSVLNAINKVCSTTSRDNYSAYLIQIESIGHTTRVHSMWNSISKLFK